MQVMRLAKLLLSFELIFLMFVSAGLYKAHPALAWFPVDLTAFFALLSLVAGVGVAVRREWRFPARSVAAVMLFGVFGFAVLASVSWSAEVSFGLEKAFIMFPLVALSFVGSALIIASDPRRVHRFLFLIVVLGLYLLTLTAQTIAREGIAGVLLGVDASNYIRRGVALAVGAAILYAHAVHAKRNTVAFAVYLGLAVIFIGGVIATGSRQAVGGVLIALLSSLPAFLHFRTVSGVVIERRVVVLLVLPVVAGVGIWYAGRSGIDLDSIQRVTPLLSGDLGGVIQGRSELWRMAVVGAAERPLFGHGVGSFGSYAGVSINDYPHNLLLELQFELGFTGVFLFVALVGFLLIRSSVLRNVGSNASNLAIVAALAVLVTSAMFSNTYAESRMLFAFLGLLCVNTPMLAVRSSGLGSGGAAALSSDAARPSMRRSGDK